MPYKQQKMDYLTKFTARLIQNLPAVQRLNALPVTTPSALPSWALASKLLSRSSVMRDWSGWTADGEMKNITC